MQYENFIENIKQHLSKPLPGEEIQFKMAPIERLIRDSALKENPNPKLSAVMVLFYPVDNIPYFVLMLRKTYKGVHSAQIGLPGGKKEDGDITLIDTAKRETEEEIGVKKTEINIIGTLTQVYIPPSGFLVHPFVGFVNKTTSFMPDSKEVERLIELPVSDLSNNSNVKTKSVYVNAINQEKIYPCFDFNGNIVWGATAMILNELKEIVNPFYK